MNHTLVFKEKHNFFKRKDYFYFALFLVLVAKKGDTIASTLFINSLYSVGYFLFIWLIDKKKIIINKNMIYKKGKRLPMKLIKHVVHNGTYLYLKFEKNQYVKIYDPQKKFTNLIISNKQSLQLSEQNLKYLFKRVAI